MKVESISTRAMELINDEKFRTSVAKTLVNSGIMTLEEYNDDANHKQVVAITAQMAYSLALKETEQK